MRSRSASTPDPDRGPESCKLLTYVHIKEDAHTMYGFYTDLEDRFLQLISVSGVGAGTARMMLSSLTPEDVQRAIVMENEKMLEGVKGIGNKTAKRIILELRDKMKKHRRKPYIYLLKPTIRLRKTR